MKELRELLKKLEAMSLEEFNEKIATFIKNSQKMNHIRSLVKDFQNRFASGWQTFDDEEKINYDEKLLRDHKNLNHFNQGLDWKNTWGNWQFGKDDYPKQG